jgi:hypothetical protein
MLKTILLSYPSSYDFDFSKSLLYFKIRCAGVTRVSRRDSSGKRKKVERGKLLRRKKYAIVRK